MSSNEDGGDPVGDLYGGNDRRKEEWHLSKGVPVGFILALIIQTLVLVSWASTFKAEFVAFREASLKEQEKVREFINAKTRDRITSREVNAELRTRDKQIESLEKDNERIINEIHTQSGQMLNRLDRIEHKIDVHIQRFEGGH